jgi:hypothetical protein
MFTVGINQFDREDHTNQGMITCFSVDYRHGRVLWSQKWPAVQ